MRISAKADYAVRAVAELAAAEGEKPVKAERIATAQGIPLNFLENILGELRHAGIVRSHDGAASSLPRVWIAVRANLRRVMEQVSIADIASAELPDSILELTEDPGAW